MATSPMNSPQRAASAGASAPGSAVSHLRPDYGLWSCCKCKTESSIHLGNAQHPVGSLSCRCLHKPCESCHFTGPLKYFLPISEPLMVPITDQGRGGNVPYGVVCGGCGLSWRAEELRKVKKVPSIMKMADVQKKRLAPQFGKLRKSQSLMNLKKSFGSQAKKEEQMVEKRVRSTSVQFTGLKCTCGWPLDVVPEETAQLEPAQPLPSRATNDRLQAMGHHEPELRVRHVRHPNPLRGNPVEPSDLV